MYLKYFEDPNLQVDPSANHTSLLSICTCARYVRNVNAALVRYADFLIRW